MCHSRTGSPRVVLPLAVLAVLFVLAAMMPVATRSPSASAASKGPALQAGSQATTRHRPSAVFEGIAIASFSVVLAGGLWLTFLFARLIVRRPKKNKEQFHRETPRAARSDVLMLALVIALGAMAVVGLRIAFGSRHESFALPTMALRHFGVPAGRPPAEASAPPIRRGARRAAPLASAFILAGFVGLALLAFYGVHGGWETMEAQNGPGSPPPVGGQEQSPGEEMSPGIHGSYAAMCRMLASTVPFRSTVTPREYAEEVRRAGFDCPAVLALTLLFELERYGGCALLPAEVEVSGPAGERIVIDPATTEALLASVARRVSTDRGEVDRGDAE